nr:putative ribonuclease H-like domain-containing protein [Tanacetum cinerariifolium]
MTDYSLWEVILNGDSPVPTQIVEGILQPVAPTTAEQRLARKNEPKARGTLLMALPNKHQLKYNSHKDAKTLIEAIEKIFGRNTKTKKIHDRLQKLVSQLEIHVVSLSQEDVNLKFLRSLPSEWKTHTLIWRNKADLEEQSLNDLFNSLKIYETEVKLSTSLVSYSFFASQSTSPQFDNKDLKQIDVDDLEEIDLRWQMAMLTMRARRKRHFARECRSLKDPRRPGVAEPQRRIVLVKTSTSNALVSQCHESDCESCPPSNLYYRFQPSGGYHAVPPPYTRTFMPPKPDLVFNTAPTAVKPDHLAFNVQLSPTKPKQDLSHTSRPSAPIIEPIKTTIPAAASVLASLKSNSSGKRRNRKACFVCKIVDHLIKDCDYHTKKMAQPIPRNYAHRGHHKQYASLTHSKPQKHRVHTAVLTQSKPVSNTVVRPVSAALPNITVTRPRNAHQVITKSKSPIRRHITHNPSSRISNSPPRVNAVQVLVVSVVQVDLHYRKRAIGTKWVYRNKKDERGIVIMNKERLVAQGHTQEEGTNYEEVFAPVARIKAIRLFLAYASFMGFMVYQMDVKSAFLYGTIEKEVYVCQPPRFEDPDHPDKVYKVVKALYGLHKLLELGMKHWLPTF